MVDEVKKGLAIGGPSHGNELLGIASKIVVPCNPHRPRNPTENSPAIEHDYAEYHWRDGAWQYQTRQRLPWLRHGLAVPLKCQLGKNTMEFTAEFNFYPDGRLGEVFARPFKTGADLEGLLDKFCIAVSKLLQRGEDVEAFWAAIDDGTPDKDRDIFSALLAGGAQAQIDWRATENQVKGSTP
jgi:hypothetical protein